MSKYIRKNGKNKAAAIMLVVIMVLAALWVILENGAQAQQAGVVEYPMANQHITWSWAGRQ